MHEPVSKIAKARKCFSSYISSFLTKRPFISVRADAVMSFRCVYASRSTVALAAGTAARLHITVHATILFGTKAKITIYLKKKTRVEMSFSYPYIVKVLLKGQSKPSE